MSLLNFGISVGHKVQLVIASAELKLCSLCAKLPGYEVVTIKTDSIDEFERIVNNHFPVEKKGGFTLTDKRGDGPEIFISVGRNDKRIFTNK